MYIKRNIDLGLVMRYAWKDLIYFILYSTLVYFAYTFFGIKYIDLPYEPLTVVGIAVAFYVGFKNKESYDRFWEGRKIWGGIVNYSRSWANQVLNLGSIDDKDKAVLIKRHIAWINALRIQLRTKTSFSPEENIAVEALWEKHGAHTSGFDEIEDFISEKEFTELMKRKNRATHLVKNQGADVKRLEEVNKISEFDKIILHKSMEEFYNLQGKCERIKNTPFPRQYAYFTTVFTYIFVSLIPLGMLNAFENNISMAASDKPYYIALMIPFSVVLMWIFTTMDKVGDSSEDPFEGKVNDVPMTALCRTIEIDLLDMLNEKELPAKIEPIDNILY